MTAIEDQPDAASLKIGIVVASWNQTVTDRLLDGALARLVQLGVHDPTVLRVPGALEIPVGVKALIDHGFDAVVAIGTVIKGETDHYDIVVENSNAGLSRLAVSSGVPIGNAILAVHDVEDALERSGMDDANKGAEAASAAVSTVMAIRQLAGS